MDARKFKELVAKAKADPKFFHDLVFAPEKVIETLGEIDGAAKGAILSKSPESVIGAAITELAGCDVTCTSSCGATCAQSCGYTTNRTEMPIGQQYASAARMPDMAELAGCDVTCTSSCGATCAQSCGYTTNLTDMFAQYGRRSRFR